MTARLMLSVSQAGARLHFTSEEFADRLLCAFGRVLSDHYLGVFYGPCKDSQSVSDFVKCKRSGNIEWWTSGSLQSLRASCSAEDAKHDLQPTINELESQIRELRGQKIARDAKITELGAIAVALRQRTEEQRHRADNAEAWASIYISELTELKSKANRKFSGGPSKIMQPLKTIERVIRRSVRRVRQAREDPAPLA